MDPEQYPDLIGLGLKAAVCRSPLLHSPEPLDPSVRITEDSESEDADHDEEDDDPEEADEQFGTDLGRHAADSTHDRVIGSAGHGLRGRGVTRGAPVATGRTAGGHVRRSTWVLPPPTS